MIDDALNFIVQQLNNFLNNSVETTDEEWIKLSNLIDQQGGLCFENMALSLISIEEERANKSQSPFNINANNTITVVNPEIKLNLNLMFAANFEPNYSEALKFISLTTIYFQGIHVFTSQNSPSLPQGIEKLILDLSSPSSQELQNIWGYLGTKYMPSVIYKARLLVIQSGMSMGDVPAITTIDYKNKVRNS